MSWNDGKLCETCTHWRRDDEPAGWGECTSQEPQRWPNVSGTRRTSGNWCGKWVAGSQQAALSRYRAIRVRLSELGAQRQALLEEQEALVTEAMQLGREWDLPVEQD